jgi:hypothetical protein
VGETLLIRGLDVGEAVAVGIDVAKCVDVALGRGVGVCMGVKVGTSVDVCVGYGVLVGVLV